MHGILLSQPSIARARSSQHNANRSSGSSSSTSGSSRPARILESATNFNTHKQTRPSSKQHTTHTQKTQMCYYTINAPFCCCCRRLCVQGWNGVQDLCIVVVAVDVLDDLPGRVCEAMQQFMCARICTGKHQNGIHINVMSTELKPNAASGASQALNRTDTSQNEKRKNNASKQNGKQL